MPNDGGKMVERIGTAGIQACARARFGVFAPPVSDRPKSKFNSTCEVGLSQLAKSARVESDRMGWSKEH